MGQISFDLPSVSFYFSSWRSLAIWGTLSVFPSPCFLISTCTWLALLIHITCLAPSDMWVWNPFRIIQTICCGWFDLSTAHRPTPAQALSQPHSHCFAIIHPPPKPRSFWSFKAHFRGAIFDPQTQGSLSSPTPSTMFPRHLLLLSDSPSWGHLIYLGFWNTFWKGFTLYPNLASSKSGDIW